MVDGQLCLGKLILKGHLEQEIERPAVNAGPIGVRGQHRPHIRLDLDRKGQLAQVVVDDRGRQGRREFQDLEEVADGGPARPGDHPSVGEMNLHVRAGGYKLELRRVRHSNGSSLR